MSREGPEGVNVHKAQWLIVIRGALAQSTTACMAKGSTRCDRGQDASGPQSIRDTISKHLYHFELESPMAWPATRAHEG
jgi:hypothetical protein